MKTLKIILISLAFIIPIAGKASGQSLTGNYHVALGLRAGETSGATVKFGIRNSSSIELLAGFWSDWLSLTGLYEKNVPAFNVEGMRWYYGGGAHVAFVTRTYYNEGRYYNRGQDYALGIDGTVGIEYKIPPIPFAISVDIKPFMEFYRNGDLNLGVDPGIGVKFTF